MAKAACSVCSSQVDSRQLVNPQKLEDGLVALIQKDFPSWDGKRGVCAKCREQFRAKKFLGYLEAEYHKLSELETSLVTKIARRGRVTKLVDQEFEEKMTIGARVADRVAQFGGSWRFILLFAAVLVAWMGINAYLLAARPFDPYPFILLNLVLSTLAAIQAPVIMMSQNRQSEKDRLHAQMDYEINLMAEMEIRDLHDKMDALRLKQLHELWQMQQRQIQMLEVLQRILLPADAVADEASAASPEQPSPPNTAGSLPPRPDPVGNG